MSNFWVFFLEGVGILRLGLECRLLRNFSRRLGSNGTVIIVDIELDLVGRCWISRDRM